MAVFVMLNPSTADATKDDATIRKCTGFAKLWNCGGIEVVNLFAYRARDPRDLFAADKERDIIGVHNDSAIRLACCTSDGGLRPLVVCAWGAHARGLDRASYVLQMIRELGARPYALDYTLDGIPRHPLMLPYTCRPQEMK